MSSECPDEAMFKAKYAEIAALKKALEQPRDSQRCPSNWYVSGGPRLLKGVRPILSSRLAQFNRRPHPYAALRPLFSNQSRVASAPFSHNVSAIFNPSSFRVTTGSADESLENGFGSRSASCQPGPKYIVSGNKLTLAGAAYSSGHPTAPHASEMVKKKIAAAKEAAAAKKCNAKFKLDLPADLVKTDNCDRIRIENNKYAITRGGNRLVPLDFFNIQSKSKLIMWNGAEYTRKNGQALRIAKKSKRYVYINFKILSDSTNRSQYLS